MGKHCGAQVNACANERNASKLAISQREQPSVYDEVINVNVNVIVEKNKVAFIFPSVAYQIQNKRGLRFRNFASEIKRVTPL